jgi:D-3-phosphoglycerate dehydrogenase
MDSRFKRNAWGIFLHKGSAVQIGILEPDDFSPKAVGLLERIGVVAFYPGINLDLFLENKDALFIRLNHIINSAFLKHAARLKYLCSPTTGLNHIDLRAAAARKIKVLSLRGETAFLNNIRATPEHAAGMTLALLRNYSSAFQSGDKAVWNRDLYKGDELFGNQIGIVGFGRVGRLLAGYFRAFGAEIFFHDVDNEVPVDKDNGIVRMNDLKSLIENVNVVVLAASYSEKNIGFFSKNYLEMLEGKYFINIARGELVDEQCLIELIKKKFFKGVALDVIAAEGDAENNFALLAALAADRNLIITPHIGGATFNAMARTEEFIASKLVQMIDPAPTEEKV